MPKKNKNATKVNANDFKKFKDEFYLNIDSFIKENQASNLDVILFSYLTSMQLNIAKEAKAAFDDGIKIILNCLIENKDFLAKPDNDLIDKLIWFVRDLAELTANNKVISPSIASQLKKMLQAYDKNFPNNQDILATFAVCKIFGFCCKQDLRQAEIELCELIDKKHAYSILVWAQVALKTNKIEYAVSLLIRISQEDETANETLQEVLTKHENNAAVQYRLAQIYLYGIGVEPDKEKFLIYMKKVLKLKHPTASFLYTYNYEYKILNDLMAKDITATLPKINSPYAPAKIAYSAQFLRYCLPSQYHSELAYCAFQNLYNAIPQSELAENIVAYCYRHGIGIKQNEKLNEMHLRNSAKRGYKPALLLLAKQNNQKVSEDFFQESCFHDKPIFPHECLLSNEQVDLHIQNINYWQARSKLRKLPCERLPESEILNKLKRIKQKLASEKKITDEMLEDLHLLIQHDEFNAMKIVVNQFIKDIIDDKSLKLKPMVDNICEIIVDLSCALPDPQSRVYILTLSNKLLESCMHMLNNGLGLDKKIADASYKITATLFNTVKSERSKINLAAASAYGLGHEVDKKNGLNELMTFASKDAYAFQLLQSLQIYSENYPHAVSLMIKNNPKILEHQPQLLKENDANLHYRLAQHYLYGIVFARNKEKFLEHYEKAKTLNHPHVDFLIGYALAKGIFYEKNVEAAVTLLEKEAGERCAGYLPAAIVLAKLYLDEFKDTPNENEKYKKAELILCLIRNKSAVAKYLIIDGIHHGKIRVELGKEPGLLSRAAEGGYYLAKYTQGNVQLTEYTRTKNKILREQALTNIVNSMRPYDFYANNEILSDNQLLDEQCENFLKNNQVFRGLITLGDFYIKEFNFDEAVIYLTEALSMNELEDSDRKEAIDLINKITPFFLPDFKPFNVLLNNQPDSAEYKKTMDFLIDWSSKNNEHASLTKELLAYWQIRQNNLAHAVTLLINLAIQDNKLQYLLDNFLKQYGTDPEVQVRLAKIYLYNIFGETVQEKYEEYCSKIEKSKPEDYLFLKAYQKFYGIFVEVNQVEAMEMLKQLVLQNHIAAALFYLREVIENTTFHEEESFKLAINILVKNEDVSSLASYVLSQAFQIFNSQQALQESEKYFNNALANECSLALLTKSIQKNCKILAEQAFEKNKLQEQSFENDSQLDIMALNRAYWGSVELKCIYPWERMAENEQEKLTLLIKNDLLTLYELGQEKALQILEQTKMLCRHQSLEIIAALYESYGKRVNIPSNFIINNKLDEVVIYSLEIVHEMLIFNTLNNERLVQLSNLINRLLRVIINLKIDNKEINFAMTQKAYQIVHRLAFDANNKQSKVTKALMGLYGIVPNQDKKVAVNELMRLINLGCDDALYGLAIWSEQQKDYSSALILFASLKNREYPDATSFFERVFDKYDEQDKYYILAQTCLYNYANNPEKSTQEFVEYFTQLPLDDGKTLFMKYLAMQKGIIAGEDPNESLGSLLQAARKTYKPAQIMLASVCIFTDNYPNEILEESIRYLNQLRNTTPIANFLLAESSQQRKYYFNKNPKKNHEMIDKLLTESSNKCVLSLITQYAKEHYELDEDSEEKAHLIEVLERAKNKFETDKNLSLLLKKSEDYDISLIEHICYDRIRFVNQEPGKLLFNKENILINTIKEMLQTSDELSNSSKETIVIENKNQSSSCTLSESDRIKIAKEEFIKVSDFYKKLCNRLDEYLKKVKESNDKIAQLHEQFIQAGRTVPNELNTEFIKVKDVYNKFSALQLRKFSLPVAECSSQDIELLSKSITREQEVLKKDLNEIRKSFDTFMSEQKFIILSKKIKQAKPVKEVIKATLPEKLPEVSKPIVAAVSEVGKIDNKEAIMPVSKTPDNRHTLMVTIELPAKENSDPAKPIIDQGKVSDPLPEWRAVIDQVEALDLAITEYRKIENDVKSKSKNNRVKNKLQAIDGIIENLYHALVAKNAVREFPAQSAIRGFIIGDARDKSKNRRMIINAIQGMKEFIINLTHQNTVENQCKKPDLQSIWDKLQFSKSLCLFGLFENNGEAIGITPKAPLCLKQ